MTVESPIQDRPSAGFEPGLAQRAPRGKMALRAAYLLSGAIATLMMVASALGLLVDGLYRDGPWVRAAFRGGDLATLGLAVPLLLVSLIFSVRGSTRAQPVWIGMLGYSVYNYAYYVFGARFNDVFLLHIALLSMSIIAVVCAASNLDVRGVARWLRDLRSAKWIGALLVLVGLAQGGLWVFVLLRYVVTGKVLNDIPVDAQHLVFGLDLSLLVPSLVIGGVLLYRRRAIGFVLGTAVTVFGAAYQVNLMLAGVFAERAGVPGAAAFPPEGVFLTGALALASGILLVHRERGA
jgi:hypothetical protein